MGTHLLIEEPKAKRIATSIEMLRILQDQPMNVTGIIAGDQFWVFASIPEIVSRDWGMTSEIKEVVTCPEKASVSPDWKESHG
jgi:hypothetical protein